ncbi:uncharacterized protein LOC9650552 isoform X2 [Selaginella moellendorffii]|uniref:uncharacterized protein LOC9650552 isoform X2 n=1 Tax=Selaginella moellendorffii TaxID=88036 RepID=UPI000D1C9FCF|nr:uncharacterized protein LOC9650552 isoform X2 [Selaginella moellendorffii]|eukprot:XP_024528837.1 uncharacterized protein LOC9650552 isoform X2 [Selaginella moellendorffii]
MDWQWRFLMVAFLVSLSHGEPLGDSSFSCNNTVQGPHLLADSQGYVCSVRNIDFGRGCCPEEGQQFSCSGCNLVSQCCNTFEYCVSCCLDPIHTSKEFALSSKSARQLTAANFVSVFEYCTGRCRHNSGSVHENAYTSEYHHCFFTQTNLSSGRDHGVEAGENTDYSLITGRRGQSCDEACRQRGKKCKASILPLINECSVLQKSMNCKGACVSGSGPDLPSEVVSSAPRHLVRSFQKRLFCLLVFFFLRFQKFSLQHPGACVFNSKNTLLSCQGAHRYTKRLCPCG